MKTMKGRGRGWLFGKDDGDKRRKRKPRGEWLFEKEDENKRKKNKITRTKCKRKIK